MTRDTVLGTIPSFAGEKSSRRKNYFRFTNRPVLHPLRNASNIINISSINKEFVEVRHGECSREGYAEEIESPDASSSRDEIN